MPKQLLRNSRRTLPVSKRNDTQGASARRTAALIAACVFIVPVLLRAQTEPESPTVPPPPLVNGWQISAFTGAALNVFSGGYFGVGDRTFVAEESSFNMPYGVSINIPVFSDASLYLRAGWHGTQTVFFSGRQDSLKSIQGYGDIGDELTLRYDLFHVDVLVRLIGRQDGERVFVGPSFNYVRSKRVRLIETEYQTGVSYMYEDGDLAGAASMRTSLVLGAEYAFVPLRNLYVIPSVQVDYSPQKLSTEHPIKAVFYKFLVTVAYQPF